MIRKSIPYKVIGLPSIVSFPEVTPHGFAENGAVRFQCWFGMVFNVKLSNSTRDTNLANADTPAAFTGVAHHVSQFVTMLGSMHAYLYGNRSPSPLMHTTS